MVLRARRDAIRAVMGSIAIDNEIRMMLPERFGEHAR